MKTNSRDIKVYDCVAVVVFGSLGLGAAVAVCCGAAHQAIVAMACGVMVWFAVAELRKLKTKS